MKGRGRSIRTARASKRDIERARIANEENSVRRLPLVRGDCENGPRPCPLVSCRHHLAIDVSESTGTIKINHPGREVWELPVTCSLDVAEAGPLTLEQVAELLNVTRERTRQIEHSALRKLELSGLLDELRDVGT